MIGELQDKRIFLNHGPIQMALDIWAEDERVPSLAREVASYIISEFEKLAIYLPNLKKMGYYSEIDSSNPDVLNKMIASVNLLGDDDMNTLGAVAGSFSDIALEKALELGATRVIINNGGDIALKDLTGKKIKVGIPLGNSSKSQVVINIGKDDGIGGICTSGMGGRSFTKGIATAAVVFAKSASIADSCATHVANMTDVEDDSILRCLAEEIDSGTDIPGRIVTLGIKGLSTRQKHIALLNGATAAEKLIARDVIKGSIICIEDYVVKVPDNLLVERLK
jgi:ApbE superfamily uncharacterized protein (UPF0280 family)